MQQLHERGDVGVLDGRRIPVEYRAVSLASRLADVIGRGNRLPELSPGPLQRAVDRGHADTEQCGGLGGPPAEDIAQDQHRALPGRQLLQGGDQGEPQARPGRRDGGGIGRLRP